MLHNFFCLKKENFTNPFKECPPQPIPVFSLQEITIVLIHMYQNHYQVLVFMFELYINGIYCVGHLMYFFHLKLCFWGFSILYVDLVQEFSECALGIPRDPENSFSHILVCSVWVLYIGYMMRDVIIGWTQKHLWESSCPLSSLSLKRFEEM